MTTVKHNLKLFKWQEDTIRGIKEHYKGSIHVVLSPRQRGKSLMLQVLLIDSAINNSKTTAICLSPTLNQSRKIYQEVTEILSKANLVEKQNEIQLTIRLKNKSYILFKSAEQANGLRGYTVNSIYVVDEAAFIKDDIFYDTLAWVNTSQAPIVMCSTPQHKTGFFYNYYAMGWDNGNSVYSYNWADYDTSALLPPEKLEEFRRSLPPNKFKTEFLGEFLSNEGSVFGNYTSIISDDFDFIDTDYYFGIDWASGSGLDDTAISIFNKRKQMVALYHWNDKDETESIKEIIKICKRFPPKKIQVEINSIGKIFCGLLEKALRQEGIRTNLLKFTTTNDSKEKLVQKFQVAIQNGDVTILNDEYLKLQFDMYEMKLSAANKRTYNANSGYHDDCLMATLLAFDCINKGTYTIR